MSNALPQLIAGRYRLISPLGQGGMGRVWKARDEVLHRDVAIKELVPPPSLTPEERREMRERSLREARAIARLNNVNVVRIFDVLRTDGDPWIVMEYVPSRSLQDVLAEDGPVSPAKAVQIGFGVLGALKAAHKAGIMHRDVKPGNVLIGNDGRVVLTDFGLATIPGDPNVTRTGMVLGSPAYIAPERARDGTAGPEADLWSLGATLYAAVEGKSPYARPSAIATLAALAVEPLPPPKNAGPLKPVLQGLLRKDPAERITAEVAERLLRKAAGRRARSISLLDGVRRPGPNGPREPRPPLVPAPRPADERVGRPPATPAPRKPDQGPAAAGTADDATAKVPDSLDATPTAKVAPPAVDPPTTKLASPAAEPTTKLDAAPVLDAPEPVDVETAVDGSDPALDETRIDSTPAAAPVEPPAPPSASAQAEPVSPAPPSGRAAAIPGTKPERNRRNLLIIALAAVLVLGLAVAVPLLTSGDDNGAEQPGAPTPAASASPSATSAAPPTSAAPTSAAPSPTPSKTLASGAALPAGWELYKDETGFSVPVPPGFSLDYRRHFGSGPEDWRVRFKDGRGRALLIDQTTRPLKDAEADWRQQEARRKKDYTGYQHVKIVSVDYWREAADWEWIYTEGGRQLHVRNRGFVTAPDKGYAIRWDCPEKDWAANEPIFKIIADGFVPVRQ
ncbi:serine/threonine-protein kinase [Micromonospora eburnea]|uniref:non-specific serine/threonine protein kinase n=1 Tax=Micromonospora eburnea TaxID=227316 RepID=A0A1C6TTV2_9ACTN|nr:serine/threonine-protein kinase [Micromonospora eburnea]SCL45061.1 Serine/threonine protein kinase [Micromonospora eburnea]